MRVMLVGGGGYVGRPLARRLAAEGYQVMIVDRREAGGFSHTGVVYARGDASRPLFVKDLFQAFSPDVVIHLAKPDETYPALLHSFEDVVESLKVTLEMCAALPPRVIVLASTFEVYGDQSPKLYESGLWEGVPTSPKSTLGLVFRAAEDLVAAAARELPRTVVAILRLFPVVGMSDNADKSDVWPGNANLVARAVEAAATGGTCLLYRAGFLDPEEGTIQYEDYPLLDYLHIDDACEAFARVVDWGLKKFQEGKKHVLKVWNVGTGVVYPVPEVIRIVETVTGREVHTVDAGLDPVGIRWAKACTDLLWSDLGWAPQRSFTSAVLNAWTWFKAYRGVTTS